MLEEAELETASKTSITKKFHPGLEPLTPPFKLLLLRGPYQLVLCVECVPLRESCPLIKTKIPSVGSLENQDGTLSP